MHEIKFAENIVKVLEPQVSDPEVGKIRKIYLEVGKLHYIVPEILETGYASVPKDEKLEGAELDVVVLPIKVRCKSCGTEKEVEEIDLICPDCPDSDMEILSGKEFIVSRIEW